MTQWGCAVGRRLQIKAESQHLNLTVAALEVAACHDGKDSHVGDFVLDLEPRLQTAEAGNESEQRDKQKAGSEDLVAKGTLIKTLWVFADPGIWDLKLVGWINIFSPLQATVLYLTFWRFI